MSDSNQYAWIENADARVRLELPADWERTPVPVTNPDSTELKATSPDGGAVLEFVFITRGIPETVEEEKRLMGELDKRLTNVRITTPANHATQNGLRVFGIAGVGADKGTSVVWYSLAYGDGMGHGVLLTVVIQSSKLDAWKKVTDRIAASISPYTPA